MVDYKIKNYWTDQWRNRNKNFTFKKGFSHQKNYKLRKKNLILHWRIITNEAYKHHSVGWLCFGSSGPVFRRLVQSCWRKSFVFAIARHENVICPGGRRTPYGNFPIEKLSSRKTCLSILYGPKCIHRHSIGQIKFIAP